MAGAAGLVADVTWKVLERRARNKRSGSVYEPLKSIHLLKPDNETVWDKLDHYYRIVKSTLLLYQSPTTGLFPTKTCGGDQRAKIQDSLYCAAGVWALALAYRRIDDDKGRTHELEHSAIKCMRGVLYCYMRQADKVQQFKQDPRPTTCLHSVFNVHTGDELLSYEEYGHVQINTVSLYLLYLVEMISSGLQIIYNTDEVTFIQNLVFCVERVYRVPDFGVWERGSKYNNGSTELHSSSIGLAKAALEAINGFNLFGNQGCSWSVIFVDLDAHNRNRQTLCSLLPRESRSHNTDAALLPCISYPAFALDDDVLFSQTLDKVVRKLKEYGFKRFLRDGYRTSLEDPNRRYYKPAEIKLFDGIECEFPIFFLYMMIDGKIFRGNPKQVKEYQDLLTPVLHQTTEGYPVVPKYYYVPGFVEYERRNLESQKRFPSNCGRDGKLFPWGQALYVIAKLLENRRVAYKNAEQLTALKCSLFAS
ncbi:LOW QUALITY PROTEIN: phosphorylase b kinase regulatory subunit beta-like [Erethizon dorsatum]